VGESLREALKSRVVVSDGAMGTMLQAADPTLEDFQGLEGCNEILNVTRPDIVVGVHNAYFDVGVDAVETNTFGANWANLGEYDIAERIRELSKAGAELARKSADDFSTPDRPRWVLGSIGPGTKLPTLGHVDFATLRQAYADNALGLLEGGSDALLIETAQDLLQAKSAVLGAQEAMTQSGIVVPLIVHVTVETTGTMLLGSEIGAALNALQALGIDMIGLNCATGPAEMSEHLRVLSQQATIGLSCMPNAGLPELGAHGAVYPLTPSELADAHEVFVRDYGLSLVGGCCGTTPEHMRQVVDRVRGLPIPGREPAPEPGISSLYQPVPFDQDSTFLSIGERTNANGSKAFRQAMLDGRWDDCVRIARDQQRDGAHVLDLCVDYVGRDGVADMEKLAGLLATATTLPIVLDSTEPQVLQAGLEKLGGRSIVNSVNYEDGDGPDSRFARTMQVVQRHGAAVVALTIDEEGQARTKEWKVRVADRLITDLVDNWGMDVGDILVDTLTFPIATGQEETRRDGIETIEAIRELKQLHPGVHTTLGVSNVSFGLNPVARQVLNSVFLHECVEAGLDSAIVHASKIVPMNRIPEEQLNAALDLVYDRRTFNDDGTVLHDPLAHFMQIFAGAKASAGAQSRAEELAALPLDERLKRRIIDGERNGLEADLDEALLTRPALEIVNDVLLDGMRTVGELFASGDMQLPFVLQSAEVMKTAVAYLEPHMEKSDSEGKGTIVLATVKGDVHDIGKNLVDIILSNNGYTVVNIGIKQPVNAIIEAAEAHKADAIGMSGLLVKSTVIMKDNLEEMNNRGIADRFPVILGGAALTRGYVEQDLAEMYLGDVRYARDAFEGLSLMDAIMAVKRGDPGAKLPDLRQRRVASKPARQATEVVVPARSEVSDRAPVPATPFLGERIVKGIPLADYVAYLDERALFRGQWGLKPGRNDDRTYEEIVESEGVPRLRQWLDRVHTEGMLEAAVIYGYWPAWAHRDEIIIGSPDQPDQEIGRFHFPRQQRGRFLCLADYVRPGNPDGSAPDEIDNVAFHIVTMGNRISDAANELFAANQYRDYMELHGLSVQLTEALAEYWHSRIRKEWGIADGDSPEMARILKQEYVGERYSFGYPACPDLSQQQLMFELLKPQRVGVELSEEFQLHPEQSTSAIIFHHPEAAYFNAG
jgi:5-methyltetrahydrofolate--homocysteine methyltransferase